MTDLPAPAPTRPLYTGGILHRLTHPAEVAGALDAARTAGKIGAIGVSNHAPAELDALQPFLPVPVVSTQPEFSPLAIAPLTNGVLDEAMARRMTVLAWSPLGEGICARRATPGCAPSQRRWIGSPCPTMCPALRRPIAGSWPTRPGRSRWSAPKRPPASPPAMRNQLALRPVRRRLRVPRHPGPKAALVLGTLPAHSAAG